MKSDPTTVADFIKEATSAERTLHLRSRQYDRLSTGFPINAAAMTVDHHSSLRDVIREIVREEIQKLRPSVMGTPVASVAEIVRDEIRHAFSAGDAGHPSRNAGRCPPPAMPVPLYRQPLTPRSSPQQGALRHAPVVPMPSYRPPQCRPSFPQLLVLRRVISTPSVMIFDFDIRSIDWVTYMEQYILGVRRYVLKEDPSTIPAARRNLNRIYYIGMLAQLLFLAGVIRLLVKHTRTFNDLWWNLISNVLQLAVRISLAMQSISNRH
ncbi:hypothetical protein HPB50_005406 [Hyalomma asiaticum]|uniref:Uncharacterized protein n=1 Tax=Hyalomma asiaticum TaxID=266040 RepID=A0ACB7SQH5_HYAAI|nr:hypothetical protein HPB50_005406 [Hyalomma asiaticum]